MTIYVNIVQQSTSQSSIVHEWVIDIITNVDTFCSAYCIFSFIFCVCLIITFVICYSCSSCTMMMIICTCVICLSRCLHICHVSYLFLFLLLLFDFTYYCYILYIFLCCCSCVIIIAIFIYYFCYFSHIIVIAVTADHSSQTHFCRVDGCAASHRTHTFTQCSSHCIQDSLLQ